MLKETQELYSLTKNYYAVRFLSVQKIDCNNILKLKTDLSIYVIFFNEEGYAECFFLCLSVFRCLVYPFIWSLIIWTTRPKIGKTWPEISQMLCSDVNYNTFIDRKYIRYIRLGVEHNIFSYSLHPSENVLIRTSDLTFVRSASNSECAPVQKWFFRPTLKQCVRPLIFGIHIFNVFFFVNI